MSKSRKSIFALDDSRAVVPIPELGTPIIPCENFKRMLDNRNPLYIPNPFTDTQIIFPRKFFDAPEKPNSDGYDAFGVHWTFVPLLGVSTPTPNMKAVNSIENWKRELKWPDIEETDVDSVKEQAEKLPRDKFTGMYLGHGFFERLQHIFTLEDALAAFLCNPSEVHELFKALLDFKIKFIDKMLNAGNGIFDFAIHSDDMGTQRRSFFSREIFEEFIFPYNKELFDYAHGRGLYIGWHSYGDNTSFLDYMAALNTDWWELQPAANDLKTITESYGDKIVMQFPFDINIGYSDEVSDEEAIELVHKYVDASLARKNHSIIVEPVRKRIAELIIPEFRKYSLKQYVKKDDKEHKDDHT